MCSAALDTRPSHLSLATQVPDTLQERDTIAACHAATKSLPLLLRAYAQVEAYSPPPPPAACPATEAAAAPTADLTVLPKDAKPKPDQKPDVPKAAPPPPPKPKAPQRTLATLNKDILWLVMSYLPPQMVQGVCQLVARLWRDLGNKLYPRSVHVKVCVLPHQAFALGSSRWSGRGLYGQAWRFVWGMQPFSGDGHELLVWPGGKPPRPPGAQRRVSGAASGGSLPGTQSEVFWGAASGGDVLGLLPERTPRRCSSPLPHRPLRPPPKVAQPTSGPGAAEQMFGNAP